MTIGMRVLPAYACFAGLLISMTNAQPSVAGEAATLHMPSIRLRPPEPPAADYGTFLAKAFDEAEIGDDVQAIADAEKSLSLAREQLGTSDETLAHIMEIVADFYLGAKEYDQARHLIEQTLRVEGKSFDSNSVDLAMATKLSRLGQSLEFADPPKFSRATPLLEQALAVREKVLGYDSPFVAASLYDLANNMVFLEKFAEGGALYKRAIAVCEKDARGNKNNLVAILNDMALMYMKQGRYDNAEPVLKRALTLAQQPPKAEDSVVAQILNNLSRISKGKGRSAPRKGG